MAKRVGEVEIGIIVDASDVPVGVGAAKREVAQFGQTTDKVGQQTQRLESHQRSLGQEAGKGAQSQKRYAEAVGKTGESKRRMGEETKALSGQVGEFGKELGVNLPKLTKTGLALGAIGLAAKMAGLEIERYREIEAAGKEGIDRTFEARKRLFQLTDDPARARQLTLEADRAAIGTSLTREEAMELRFGGESLNFGGEFGDVARAAQLVGQRAGDVGGALRNKFAESQPMSAMTAIGSFLVGAEKSVADFDQLAEGASRAGFGGSAIGEDFQGTVANLAAMANATNDPRQSANLLRTFGLKASTNEDLKGLGFAGAVKKLEGDEELRESFIGQNQELRTAFNAMSSGKFKEELAKIRSAVDKEFASGGASLERRVTNFENDPASRAFIQEQNAKEKVQLAAQSFAERRAAQVERLEGGRAAAIAEGETSDVTRVLSLPGAVRRMMMGQDVVQAQDEARTDFVNKFGIGGEGLETKLDKMIEVLERQDDRAQQANAQQQAMVNADALIEN